MKRAIVIALWLTAAGAAGARELRYDATLSGVEGELRRRIEEASRLIAWEDRPPASVAALRRRIDEDRPLLIDVLHAAGHWGARIEVSVDETASPVAVRLAVTPGPAYRLSEFAVRLRDGGPLAVPLDDLGLALGEAAATQAILDAEARLLAHLARRARPLAKVADRQVVVDHAARAVRVALLVDDGPLAVFGPARVTGAGRVERDFLIGRLPWREGDPFDSSLLEEARERLALTGLFSSVRVKALEEEMTGGRLPVSIVLAERPPRSIGAGVSFSTSEGPGAEVFWEHRNLLDEGERFRVSAQYNTVEGALVTTFRKPDVLGYGRDLFGEISARREETDGYDSARALVTAGLDYRISRIWSASAALALERERVEEDGRRDDFALISLPLEARRDTSDDLLDPTRGSRLTAILRPYADVMGSNLAFTRTELHDAVYLQVLDEPRLVLAGWARAGVILGADTMDLPPDKRFYAGGGGSVRGYGYQMAGPLDAQGDPIGGRSLLAGGVEARVRVTETIGVVPFIEGGNVWDERLPDIAEGLLWGAGLGVRYATPIGPVRADIAVPLERRPQDDSFQVYLGQAF
ncbi:MAG: outer membrane protein assembly factor [Alphaproteobacteria bacterium]|nr:outer membrane protein assembly factor [Alphaproteobacteria bacterium]